MLDALLSMVQSGVVSQGVGSLHLFDLFTEVEMNGRGAKKTISFGEDEEEVTHVQGLGQDYDLHWSLNPTEKKVEIVNLDDNNYKIIMSDGSGVSEVSATINGEPGNLELRINGNISSEDQMVLAKNLKNLEDYAQNLRNPSELVVKTSAVAVFAKPHGHQDDHDDGGDHGI